MPRFKLVSSSCVAYVTAMPPAGLNFTLTSLGNGVGAGVLPLPGGARHVGRGVHLIEYVGNYVTVEDETVEVYLDGAKAGDVTNVQVEPEDGFKDALIFSGKDAETSAGTLPSKRFGHASVVVGGDVLLFGGAEGSNREPTDELYAIDMGADYALYSTTDYTLIGANFNGAKDGIVKVTINTNPAYVSFDCADIRFKSMPDQKDLDYWIDPDPGCKSGRTVAYVKAPTTGFMRMVSRGARAPVGSSAEKVFDVLATFEPGSRFGATEDVAAAASADVGGAAASGGRCEAAAAPAPEGLFEIVDNIDAVTFEGSGALIVNPDYTAHATLSSSSSAAAAAASAADYGRGHVVVASFDAPVEGAFYVRASFYDIGYEPGVATEHTLVLQSDACDDVATVGVTSAYANSARYYVGAPGAANGNPALIPVATDAPDARPRSVGWKLFEVFGDGEGNVQAEKPSAHTTYAHYYVFSKLTTAFK